MTSASHAPTARASSSPLRPTQPTALALAILAFLAVAAFCVVGAAVAVPPSLVNLSSATSDGTTPYALQAGGAEVDVVVPAGWIVRRESERMITVTTPDGVMTARVDLVDENSDAVVSGHPDLASHVRSEVLPSGREVVHADAAGGAVVAAVGVLGRALSPSVRVVATADPSSMSDYRPALAQLLEGVGS